MNIRTRMDGAPLMTPNQEALKDMRNEASSGGGQAEPGLPAANPAALRDLLRRVESATGADALLDRQLAITLGAYTFEKRGRDRRAWFYPADKEWFYRRDIAPPYTASLDAALALVERVLPGWGFYLRRDKDGCGCGLVHPEFPRVTPGHQEAPTPALALLAALLRALDTQSQQDEPTSKVGRSAEPRRSGHQCPNQIPTQDVEKPSHG